MNRLGTLGRLNKLSSSPAFSWQTYWATLIPLKSLMTFWGNLRVLSGSIVADKSGNGNNGTIDTMALDKDSMVLNSSLQATIDGLGVNDDFYDNTIYESSNAAKPFRPKDKKIIGNRIFGSLWDLIVFGAALTGDTFKIVTNALYRLKNFNRFLTTYNNLSFVDFNGNNANIFKKTYFTPGITFSYPAHGTYSILNNLTLACKIQTYRTALHDNCHLFGCWGTSCWDLRLQTSGKILVYIRQANLTYVSLLSDLTYCDGKEHQLMMTADSHNLILTTDLETKSTPYIDDGQNLVTAADPVLTTNGMENFTNSNMKGFISDCYVYNAIKTYADVIALSETNCVFRSKDTYNCDHLAEHATINGGGVWANMYVNVDTDVKGDTLYTYNGRYYPNKIDLNPTNSADVIFELYDKRNIVGNGVGRPEIWNAVIYDATRPFVWDVRGGTYNFNMATVEKYMQTPYKGRLFIKQIHKINLSNTDPNSPLYEQDRSYVDTIISYPSVPSAAEKTKAYEFVNFPKTSIFPAIVGDGTTDDAIAINAAFASAEGVIIYKQTAKIQQPVKIPSNKYLIIADGQIFVNNGITDNTIRNDDLPNGNSNINLIGLGSAIVNANGGNQNRTLYPDDGYHYFNIFFNKVSKLYISGLKMQKSTAWTVALQRCDNYIVENIDLELQDNVQLNQDGVGSNFGSKNGIVRNIMGYVYDDFLPLINSESIADNLVPYKTGYLYRKTEKIYFENIIPWYNYTNIVRLVPFNVSEVSHCKFRNIKTRVVFNGAFDFTDYTYPGGNINNIDIRNVLINNSAPALPQVVRLDQTVNDIAINNLIMKTGFYNYLISIKNGRHITDTAINSKIYIAPNTAVLQDLGGILDNFTHSET